MRASVDPQIVGPGSGRMLPTLVLASAEGERVPLWRYRGRCPLVLLVHRGRVDLSWLDAYAERYEDFRAAEAEVLAVGPEMLVELPVPGLLDGDARLARRLELAPPAVIVADRPGEVWAAWGDGSAEHLPGTDEVLSWLEFAQSECRECFCCEQVWPDELRP